MHLRVGITTAFALTLLGCALQDDVPSAENVGKIDVALSGAGPMHDVEGVHFAVVEASQSCDAAPLVDTTIGDDRPSVMLDPSVGSGADHAFANTLFVLPPGSYRVCATPLAIDGPSARCTRAEGSASVMAQMTTEVVLVMQCEGEANGGLDLTALLNDPPVIEDLEVLPSRFITTCESAEITVSPNDPNGDELQFAWEVTASPDGASPTLEASDPGSTASFSTDTAGDYALRVTLTDAHGAETAITLPVQVSACEVDLDGPGVFISDMTWLSQGGVMVRRDADWNGSPISLDGVTYAKGVMTHPGDDPFVAYLVVDVASCTHFAATIGIDDTSSGGHVEFSVLLDGAQAYTSGPQDMVDPARDILIPLAGATQLQLRASAVGDDSWDWAVWANARLLGCAP